MQNRFKRFLSLSLALMMIICQVPMTAFAEELDVVMIDDVEMELDEITELDAQAEGETATDETTNVTEEPEIVIEGVEEVLEVPVEVAAEANTVTESEEETAGETAEVRTLEELKAALADEKYTTVKLTKKIELTERLVINRDVVLDLGSKKITAEFDDYAIQVLNGNVTVQNGSVEAEVSAFRVGENIDTDNGEKQNVTLTIASDVCVEAETGYGVVIFDGTLNVYGDIEAVTGISGNGTAGNGVTAVNIEAGAVVTGTDTGIYYPNTGALNIKGGEVSGLTGIYAKAGTVTVTGGTIKGTGAKAEFVANYNGGNPTGDALVLDLTAGYQPGLTAVIQGGTFISANASAVGSYSSTSDAALNGFITGGQFSSNVTALCGTDLEAVKADGADYYTIQNVKRTTVSTLDELKAALAKSYIEEVEVTSMIVVKADETLDLAGKKVVAGKDVNYAIQALNGNVTVTNGTVEAENSAFRVGENVETDNGEKQNVTLTIAKDVTVNAGAWGVVIFDGTLNVYGKIYAETGISGNGTAGNDVVAINVEDGAVVAGTDTGIYYPNVGELNIKGGEVSGLTGIYAKAGTVTVTGGTIKGTGAKADFDVNYNGGNPTGDALVLDLTAGYQPGLTAVISGGTFVSTNASAVGSYSSIDGTAALTGFITGGTFSSDVIELTVSGYDVTANSNGTYTVAKHVHNYTTLKSEKAPTCTAAGQKVYACECGETNTVTVAATGHTYDAGTITKAPTCVATGVKTYKCACGATKTETVAATGVHTYGNWTTVTEKDVFNAEVQKHTCKVCGKEETRSYGEPAERILEISGKLKSITMKKGETDKCEVIMAAGDSLKSSTSSNTKVVKVTANKKAGTITLKALKAGTSNIKITLASGKTRTYKVTVKTAVVKTTGISVESTKITLKKGKTQTLKPVLTPFTSTQKITYKTSNKKIVTVTKAGKIKAVAAGTAKITITSGSKKKVVTVTVPGITNVKTKATVKVGKTLTLKPKKFGISEKFTYTSSNKKIATVTANGKVKGIKKGTATITIKAGSYSVKCKVTVKK